jgi:GT2 family glycosyltransferase
MARPHVALVVLSWNGRRDLEESLPSLAEVDYEPLTTIVVDNGSTDGTVGFLEERFPDVEIVALEQNMGFCAGMNAGARRATELGAEQLLFLNNDIEVDPHFVAALVDEAGRRPDAAALLPKIYLADPPDRIWYFGAKLDPRKGYQGAHVGFNEVDEGQFSEVTETERACGAAMLVPRRIFEEVGEFDEELFLYADDTDWSLRARHAGYRLLVVPESRIWHRVSSANEGEGSPKTLYYSTRNTLHVLERHAPLGPLGTWRRRLVVVLAHAAQAVRLPRRREALSAILAGWRDFRRGRYGPRAG